MNIDPRISTETKTVRVYRVEDQEFSTPGEATAYLKEIDALLDWKFCFLNYAPDLTEGRGFQRTKIVATQTDTNSIIAYALENVNASPVVRFYDRGTAAWRINDLERFQTTTELLAFLRSNRRFEVVYVDDFGKVLDTPPITDGVSD